jgi:hypothetical protein
LQKLSPKLRSGTELLYNKKTMDIEKLTKHQIILLALLVSFMTSIATGIVTVSLMNQASPSVSHTINEIVQRTVQTIAAPATAVGAAPLQNTVVVKDDDLVAQSIATAQKSVIRITAKGGTDLIARGVLIDSKGTTLTDAAALADSGATAFEAILPDGTHVPMTVNSGNASSTLAVVEVALGTSTSAVPASLADESKLALGQSVLRIGGTGADTVGEGVIATLPSSGSSNTPGVVQTTVQSTTPGALLMDIFGQVIGITTSDSQAHGADYYTLIAPPKT